MHIPYVMGVIGTRSIDTEILGIQDIKKLNADRIINGVTAVSALDLMRQNKLNGIKKSASTD